MEEVSQDAPTGGTAGTSTDAGGSSPSGGAEASTSAANATDSTSSANVTTSPSQTPQTQDAPVDILAGLPSVDELKAQGEQGIKYAASLAQVRGAYEDVKPKYEALSSWQPIADHFGDVERANEAIGLLDSLYGYEHDPQGRPIPSTAQFVEKVSGNPQIADNLTADLLFSPVEVDGRQARRLDVVLGSLPPEELINNLAQRKEYQDIRERLSREAPQWAATEEDLAKVDPQYHDLLRKMPPEERNELLLNSDLFIKDYLRRAKAEGDYQAAEERRQAAESEERQRQEQALEQGAVTAADAFVDKDIREGLSGLINGIAENNLTDDPEVNKGVGALVGLAVAALAHKDLRPLAEELLSGIVDKESLGKLDAPLQEWVRNTYAAGYLRHKDPNAHVDTPMGNARSARNRAIVQANAVATRIMPLFSKVFSLKAESHNNVLDGADRGRPVITGQGVDPASSTRIQPSDTGNPFSPENNRRVVSTFAR